MYFFQEIFKYIYFCTHIFISKYMKQYVIDSGTWQGYLNTASVMLRESAKSHDLCWPSRGFRHRLQWFVSIPMKFGQISSFRCQLVFLYLKCLVGWWLMIDDDWWWWWWWWCWCWLSLLHEMENYHVKPGTTIYTFRQPNRRYVNMAYGFSCFKTGELPSGEKRQLGGKSSLNPGIIAAATSHFTASSLPKLS